MNWWVVDFAMNRGREYQVESSLIFIYFCNYIITLSIWRKRETRLGDILQFAVIQFIFSLCSELNPVSANEVVPPTFWFHVNKAKKIVWKDFSCAIPAYDQKPQMISNLVASTLHRLVLQYMKMEFHCNINTIECVRLQCAYRPPSPDTVHVKQFPHRPKPAYNRFYLV